MSDLNKTKIFSELISGIPNGYVTDVSQVRGAASDKDVVPTSLLYSELIRLRDENKLVPGHYYRITDYKTTCCASGLANNTVYFATHSDILVFDIMVKALDVNTLSSQAVLLPKMDVTYGVDLSKFEVRYDIDNNAAKYEFADVATQPYFYYSRYKYFYTEESIVYNNVEYFAYSNGTTTYYLPTLDPRTSTDKKLYRKSGSAINATTYKFLYGVCGSEGGKGVIYYMKDDLGNEAPYDFKNIAFIKYSDQSKHYTFASGTNNRIGEYLKNGVLVLNNISVGLNSSFNFFDKGCYSIDIGDNAISNRFGVNCNNIQLLHNGAPASYVQYNIFGDNCSSLTLNFSETPTSTQPARYLDVATGLYGNLTLDYFIGAVHTTLVLKGSDGELVYSNLLDLINLTGINQVQVTYSELIQLRDNNALIPGVQYRITDYNTTVGLSNASLSVANHRFDIIVTADSTSTLMEKATAIHNAEDNYFADIPLQAWELKYCIDNDTNRFPWTSSDGKGVIYYMKDENNNICYYDFKNILLNGQYTFHHIEDGVSKDVSAVPQCCNNVIKSIGVIFATAGNCSNNTVETGVSEIVFKDNCHNNHIGQNCSRISFGEDCQNNTVGANSSLIMLASSCWNNSFGTYCSNINVGTQSKNNKFGNSCGKIYFTNNAWYNVFGDGCYNIYADNHFQNNTFGAECHDIMFSKYNTSVYIPTNYRGYCQNCKFSNGSCYLVIYKECEVCLSNRINNLNILSGLAGTSSQYISLEIDNLNIDYEIFIGKDSNNQVKMFSLTDLIL